MESVSEKKSRWFSQFVEEELPNDVSGKVFVITGTTTGTGFVAARTVAQLGGEVVLLNRPSPRVDVMLTKLKEAVPNGKFVTVECDLQDFDSVRKASNEIRSKYDQIYCLCNNAGIMATPDRATKDGYDEQIQTNHLSHFLLTKELFPLLERQAKASGGNGGDARIVNHSSEARNNTASKGLERRYFEQNGDGNLGGDRLGLFSGPCFERYCQSKLANSVFTHALHDKLQAAHSNVKVVSAHPGGADTNLGSHLNFGTITNWLLRHILFPMVVQSSEDGTMGLLKGMMGDKDTIESGVMYGPHGMKGKAVALDPKPWEIDINAKQMLWETSEAATGVQFDVVI